MPNLHTQQESAPAREGPAKDHVWSGRNGAKSVLPRALVRPGSGAQVRAGPRNKSGRALRSAAQAARDRARPQSRSTSRTVSNADEHEKRAGTVSGPALSSTLIFVE